MMMLGHCYLPGGMAFGEPFCNMSVIFGGGLCAIVVASDLSL
jgi:hypothetical protein